jgi:hypothetical protein
VKEAVPIFAVLVFIAGCAAPPRGAVIQSHGAPVANLALSKSAEVSRLAQAWAARSDWPVTEIGQRTEDMTFYSTVTYDEQYHYDRNGGLYRGAQTVQTGVWLR